MLVDMLTDISTDMFFIVTFPCLCEVLLHLKFRRATQAFDKTRLVITAVYQRCPAVTLLSLLLKLQSPVRKEQWGIGGMLVAYRSTCRPTFGRYIDWDVTVNISTDILVDMLTNTTGSTHRPRVGWYVGRPVHRHIGWGVHKLHMIPLVCSVCIQRLQLLRSGL